MIDREFHTTRSLERVEYKTSEQEESIGLGIRRIRVDLDIRYKICKMVLPPHPDNGCTTYDKDQERKSYWYFFHKYCSFKIRKTFIERLCEMKTDRILDADNLLRKYNKENDDRIAFFVFSEDSEIPSFNLKCRVFWEYLIKPVIRYIPIIGPLLKE